MPQGFSHKRNTTSAVIGAAYTMTKLNEAHWSEQTKAQHKRQRNVCRFKAAAWGQGALRDSGPSGCEGDYTHPQ